MAQRKEYWQAYYRQKASDPNWVLARKMRRRWLAALKGPSEYQQRRKRQDETNLRIAASVHAGLTYSEAAERFGVSRNVVAGICHRARKQVSSGQHANNRPAANSV